MGLELLTGKESIEETLVAAYSLLTAVQDQDFKFIWINKECQMGQYKITVYGAHWCPYCRTSKMFLGEHQIPYNWVDIEENSEAQQLVTRLNKGKTIVPTIVFEDDSFLVAPSNAQIADKLGLKTKASRSHYDLIVIGGGPSGLTASIYAAREAIDTLIIERAAFGGQAAGTEKLDNMPGFPEGVEGHEFAQRLRKQAERFGVELLQAQGGGGGSKALNQRVISIASKQVGAVNTAPRRF